MSVSKREGQLGTKRRMPAPDAPPRRRHKRKPATKRSLEQKLALEQRYLRHWLMMGECDLRRRMIEDATRRIRLIETQIAGLQ